MADDAWREKLESFESRIYQDPDNGLLWLEYARFLMVEFWCSLKTLHAFKRAAELLPERDLRLALSNVYEELGETERAISIILESIRDDPRAEAYCCLASVYNNNDRFDEAKAICLKALELDPRCDEAYFLLGEAAEHKSREEAIGYYRKTVEIDPDYAYAWQRLGVMLIKSKETIEEGISALFRALELIPEDGWSRSYLANAYWQMDQPEKAEEQFLAAIDAYPEYRMVYNWYADFLDAYGRDDEALVMRDKAAACDQDD